MIGGFRYVLCVSVFKGLLLVIVLKIDGNEKHNYCERSLLTLEFPVFVKSTVKWNGYEACYTSVTCFCFLFWT